MKNSLKKLLKGMLVASTANIVPITNTAEIPTIFNISISSYKGISAIK